ncbi:nitrite/sulfite reductase [Streptomyces sp. NPDC096136]|uniref:nitrite/sulfite reductase n=1 Tax=Streptomyces sp. NPDC096136 TaxID=3366076 RepID=UPI003821B8D7
MTETVAAPPVRTARSARPAAAKRPEGQWALGEHDPLNANEEFKAVEDPLLVRERIERVYSREGFASIDPDDLRGRMRWWGLYTQRKPGIDGGKTGSLAPEELEDEHFMMRVRSDGGTLDAAQLRAVADVSMRFARNTADITDRQNVQFHWIRIEDVPAIWRRLEEVGLSTTEACGDCPRVIVGSPVAGVGADEVLDATPAVREIAARYVGDPSLSNLPRKYKSAVSWLPDVPYEINDLAFLGAVHPEHGPGFGMWVGGGLSTVPILAQHVGVWVPLADVPDVWAAVARLFRDYGYRRLRGRARLKFLVADWGVEKFRRVLEEEYLGRPLLDGPAPALPPAPIDHIGVHPQRDGLSYVGAAPLAGRLSGTKLAALADLAETHGSGRVRLTPYQKLLVLDVADPEPLITDLAEIGLQARPSPWRRNTMACTGIEYCKLAIVETKERAATLVAELEKRLSGEPDLPGLNINLNGCPNSCARTQVADIGLKGQLVADEDGRQVEGFQVHLGGSLSLAADQEGGFGKKLRGLKTTAADLPDYVERVTRAYLAGRTSPEEPFASWVARCEESDLQ